MTMRQIVASLTGHGDPFAILSRKASEEPPSRAAFPFASASVCLDCEAVFDHSQTDACPACASRATVGVPLLLSRRPAVQR